MSVSEALRQAPIVFAEQVANLEKTLTLTESGAVKTGRASLSAAQMQQANQGYFTPMQQQTTSTNSLDTTSERNKPRGQFAIFNIADIPISTTFAIDMKTVNMDMYIKQQMEAAVLELKSQIETQLTERMVANSAVTFKEIVAPGDVGSINRARSQYIKMGIPQGKLRMLLDSDTEAGYADTLQKKQMMSDISKTAWEAGEIPGGLGGVKTYRTDQGVVVPASTAANVSIRGAGQVHVMTQYVGSTQIPYDNRYQDLDITVGSGAIAPGDRFSIPSANGSIQAVHLITKRPILRNQTYLITKVTNGGAGDCTVTITPPIITGYNSAGVPDDLSLAYRNCTNVPNTGPDNGRVITMLNNVETFAVPIFDGGGIQIIPGQIDIMPDSGVFVSKITLGSGLQILLSREANGANGITYFEMRTLVGITVENPMGSGVALFNQNA